MRNALIVLLLILALAPRWVFAAQSLASPEQIEERGGLIYKSGENIPFSGTVQDYHQSGKTRLEARYEAGKLLASKVWYESGRLAEEVSVNADTWIIRRYSESGSLEEETAAVFKDGRKVAERAKVWYENGQLRTEAGFENGKLQGALKEYNPNGTLVRDELYDKGTMIKKSK